MMDLQQKIDRIYEHLDADELEKAVMACLRMARANQDHLNAIIFLRELYPSKNEVARVFYDDAPKLKPEAQAFIWQLSLDRWLELHTIEELASGQEHLPVGERKVVLKIAAAEIDPELDQLEKTLADLRPHSYNVAIVQEEQSSIRLRMKALQMIKGRLRTRCLNYAIQIERQLGLQRQTASFLWNAQNEVHNYFKVRSQDVFIKLEKAAQLSASTETEDSSLLLTEVRRTLKAVADHLYPPAEGLVKCSDGKERALGGEQYMNRLEEFLAVSVPRSTAKDLALAELKLLTAFTRRLNDMASKGVHAAATVAVARQGLVGLYMFLFNLCQLLSLAPDET